MLTANQLDNLKLVTDLTVFANDKDTLDRVELAVQQGAGGWGVRRDDGVILRLARDLKLASSMVEPLDECQRKLSGVQMENGRLKKQRDSLQDEATRMAAHIDGLESTISELRDELSTAQALLMEAQDMLHDKNESA